MDIKVIEKNKTNNLIGLIFVLVVSCLKTSSMGANENNKMILAPSKAIIQYVLMLTLLILIFGRTSNETAMSRNVMAEMTIVAIMTTAIIYLYFIKC